MAIINWSDNLSCYHRGIDHEHKILVDMVNKMHEAMKQGAGKEAMGTILHELVEYTKTHFSNEEGLMTKYGYHAHSSHHMEHEKLTTKVMQIREDYNNDKISITIEMMNFLKDWLKNHIMKVDKAFGNFLKAKGVV